MSIFPSALIVPTNNTADNVGAWLNRVDADFAAFLRAAGQWAPRSAPVTPNMTMWIDPGTNILGTTETELGNWCTGNSHTTTTIDGVSITEGITQGAPVQGWYYNAGTLTALFPANTYIATVTAGALNAGSFTTNNAAVTTTTGAIILVGQGLGGIVNANTHSNTTIDGFPAGWLTANNIQAGMNIVASGLVLTTVASTPASGATSLTTTGSATTTLTGTPITITIGAPASNPRIDRITRSATNGTITWTKGTEAAVPAAPALPGNQIPIANLYLATSTTAITNTSVIADKRFVGGGGGGGAGQVANLAIAANTADLGTITSNNVNINSGSGPINSFGSSAQVTNPFFMVQMGVAVVLTYNATSMILPGGKNITTAVGDFLTAQYLGSGNWQVVDYQPVGWRAGPDIVPPIGGAAMTTSHSLVMADIGYNALFNATTLTLTIPANSSVPFPIGTVIPFDNIFAGNLTVAITTDSMFIAGSTTGGAGVSRTVGQNGSGTIKKVAATMWLIQGAGVS